MIVPSSAFCTQPGLEKCVGIPRRVKCLLVQTVCRANVDDGTIATCLQSDILNLHLSVHSVTEGPVSCCFKVKQDNRLKIKVWYKNKASTHTQTHTLSFDSSSDIAPCQLMHHQCFCSCSNSSVERGSHFTLELSQLIAHLLEDCVAHCMAIISVSQPLSFNLPPVLFTLHLELNTAVGCIAGSICCLV